MEEFSKLLCRKAELTRWIKFNAPQVILEQRHLDEGSMERSYWTYGYLSALEDVIRLFTKDGACPPQS